MKKEKNKSSKSSRAVIISFFVLLFAGFTVALYLPLRPTYSESEKRELTKFPEFSAAALADGSYFSGISAWYADTFPWREMFIDANAKIKSFYGIGNTISGSSNAPIEEIPDISDDVPPVTLPISDSEEDESTTKEEAVDESLVQKLGAVLIVDDTAYEYYNFVTSIADKYAATVNTTAVKLGDKARVFDIVVPTSTDITLADSVRKGLNTNDQKKAINYIYSMISSDVVKVDTFDTLKAHKDEYVYFRTDHHWTALGAYYAYTEYAGKVSVSVRILKKSSLTDSLVHFITTAIKILRWRKILMLFMLMPPKAM